MGQVYVMAEGIVGAPAERVYTCIADFKQHHPRFLPSNFTDLVVQEGGVGAGTVFTFTATAARRTRYYRMRVDEPDPGRVLTESDMNSSMVSTWTVTPDGDRTRVRIETRWNGASGIKGFFERLFAPRAMQRIYADELGRLDRYARQLVAAERT